MGVSVADPIAITRQSSPPSRALVELERYFAPAGALYFAPIKIDLADYPTGPVDIYPVSASPEARILKGCRLAAASGQVAIPHGAYPSPSCQKLFEKLGTEELELAISRADSSVFAIIQLKPLKAFQGGDAAIEVPLGTDGVPQWAQVKISKQISVKKPDCYIMLDKPVQVTCNVSNQDVAIDQDARAVLFARWARKETVWLIANVLDAETSSGTWRKFALQPKAPSAPDPDPPDDPGLLEQRCKDSIIYPAQPDVYYVCVDLTRSGHGIVTLTCGRDADSCVFVGDVVQVGRKFVVRVWHDEGDREHVSLGGTPGTASMVKDGRTAAGEGIAPKVQVWHFGPRKPGTAPLSVTVVKPKADGSSTEVGKLEYSYTVEALYRFAIRLGLGFSWRPWARTVGIQASADGQRFAAVLEGEGAGLTQTELVVGLTYLLRDVRQDSLDLALGLGVRLGLLGLGADFKSFTSLSFGPELAIGPDFAIGLFAGFARHDAPNGGFEPGALIPTAITAIPTHNVATPTFMLVMNFTPGFLKSIGVIK